MVFVYIYWLAWNISCTSPVTVEDQNFALFNYVNELNGEIEMVLKQIEQVNNILHTL